MSPSKSLFHIKQPNNSQSHKSIHSLSLSPKTSPLKLAQKHPPHSNFSNMNALTSSSISVLRAPVQAAVRRQYSAAANSTNAATGHSTQRLATASTISFVVGVDVTYAYFYFKNK